MAKSPSALLVRFVRVSSSRLRSRSLGSSSTVRIKQPGNKFDSYSIIMTTVRFIPPDESAMSTNNKYSSNLFLFYSFRTSKERNGTLKVKFERRVVYVDDKINLKFWGRHLMLFSGVHFSVPFFL